MSESDAYAEDIDFAVVAYRDEGVWQIQPLSREKLADINRLAAELRRWPGDVGSLGLVSVDEDFFLLVRVQGPETKVLLSDITASCDWPLAHSAVEHLRLPLPDVEDEQVPAGDLAIVSDLGMGAMDMGALLDEYDLFPDELLGDIAARIGFGPQFLDAVGAVSAR